MAALKIDGKRPAARIILASGSPRRKELLSSLGLQFEIVVPDISEEPLPGETPENLVIRLSGEKGAEISRRFPEALVIAADTIVVIEEPCSHNSDAPLQQFILGKPIDAADAAAMLKTIQGREHTVYTGVAFVCGRPELFGASQPLLESFVGCSQVEIVALGDEEIAGYVATGEPLDKAGSYAVQGRGAAFIAGLHGSYTNVVGLPLAEVRMALLRLGLKV